MLRARAVLDLADALDAELDRRGGDRAAARRRAAADRRAGRDGAHRHRRRHRAPARRWRRSFARRGARRPSRPRTRSIGARVQPRLAQAAAGGAVRRARPAQDQADQDRLHHRRRRAARPATRRPSTRSWSTCCATATWPGCKSTVDGLLKTVADDGRIHTTFNQTIAATGRLSSHRPEPAEHPDPHRGGPPDPRGVRRRRGLRVADDGRLQPDRDADHGAPVRGRRR